MTIGPTDGVRILVGEARARLLELPDESVHCVVTSPPYWGLRDYGTGVWSGGDPECDHARPTTNMNAGFNERWGQGAGQRKQERKSGGQYGQACPKCGAVRIDQQLGLEDTPEEYVANLVDVFREVRRVLRRDGLCWLNIGDSYAAKTLDGIKTKDLLGIPWMVAFALRADGWYLRSDVIWAKPNGMPESVSDRPSKVHEYVFQLAKSRRYFYDEEAVRERYSEHPVTVARNGRSDGSAVGAAALHGTSHGQSGRARGPDGRRKTRVVAGDASLQHRDGERWPHDGRSMRTLWEDAEQHEDAAGWLADVFLEAMRAGDQSVATTVWRIVTQPYPDAHFAVFPTKLVEPCVKAGTSERGCCGRCAAPWERAGADEWRPTCECYGWLHRWSENGGDDEIERSIYVWRDLGDELEAAGTLTRAVVLDPFLGSGTTAVVCKRLGREAIGIELNEEYAALAATRIGRWWRDAVTVPRRDQVAGQLELGVE